MAGAITYKAATIPPTPQSPYAGLNKTVAGATVGVDHVKNTPISNVMYGIEWIDQIVSLSSNGEEQDDDTSRLLRKCIQTNKENDVDKLQDAYARAERLILKCNTLTREDAFTYLNAARKRGDRSKPLDSIVEKRATDALAVFKYFFRAVLRDEINRMETLTTTTTTITNSTSISDSTKRSISMLVDSKRFVEVVVALSVEVVSVARNGIHLSTGSGIYDIGPSFAGNGSNRAITLRFPAIPNAIGLNAFDVVNGIEPFVRSRPEMPREIKAYFVRIEESMLEKLSWKKGSSLYPLLRVATTKSKKTTSLSKKTNTVTDASAAATTTKKSENDVNHKNIHAQNSNTNSSNQIAAVLLGGTLASGQKVTKSLSKHHAARSLTHMQQFDRNVLGKGGDPNDESPIVEEKKKALDVAQTALRSPPRTTAVIGSGHMSAFSPLKTSAFTAFSTPAKRASGSGNMGSSSSDVERISGIAHAQQQQYNREVSSPGDAKEPLPDKDAVDDNDDDDDFECDDEKRRAKASLDVFFAKVLRLAALRLADICARLHVSQEVTRHAFQICEFVVFEKTSLLYNRHLDQIILASIYGACKISSNEQDRNVKFKDIVYRYHTQPQCVEEVFWSCPLTVTNPGLEIVSRGDIIAFYNKQFVLHVKPFMLQLRRGGESETPRMKSQKTTEMISTPKRPTAAAPTTTGLQNTPSRSRINFDPEALLKSPIREVKGNGGNGNVYVSPMRPETREKAFMHAHINTGGVDENANANHTFASPARRRKSPDGNMVALVGQADFNEINESLSQKSKE